LTLRRVENVTVAQLEKNCIESVFCLGLGICKTDN
jgi:hypothetical protein